MADPIDKFFDGFGFDVRYIYATLGIAMMIVVFVVLVEDRFTSFKFIFVTAPVWLPLVTFYVFFEAWMDYVKKSNLLYMGRVTLEIKLPQDILKSPEAMEIVLNQMYQTNSPDNHFQTYLDGRHPPKFGLEIVSRGGDVKFYISTPIKKYKNIVETQLYAQYPGIEVQVLDVDYTAEIPWDESRFSYFSIHFGLKKPDAYPIKTYIEFGLDEMPDEEEKIDPITTVLETLGNAGPGEHIWIQILIDANRKVSFKEGYLRSHGDWTEDARKEITKIITAAAERVGVEKEDIGRNVNQFLTEAEKDTIKAIERSIGKSAFNTAIRVMYIAEKAKYQPERISALITMWRSFDDLNRNTVSYQWRTDFDWNMWQDPKGKIATGYKETELDRYKRRYYLPFTQKDSSKVMTIEELATLFHIPGKVATTPTLSRIPSKRSEAPANLPVG